MKWLDELPNILNEVINSPRLLALVASATTALGAMSAMEIISGLFSGIVMITGLAATILLSRNHIIEFKNRKLTNKLLRHQVIAIGENPDA